MTDKKKTTKESEPTHKILHETHQKSKGKTAAPSVGPSTSKSTETFEEKNLRTVFVGNVHIDCVKNKTASRALLEHLLNPSKEEGGGLAPQARIDSIRYRGIPLATPIGSEPPKDQHGSKRSKAWQESQAESGTRPSFDDAAGGSAGRRGAKPLESSETTLPTVKFLTGGQKRKIGYVTGDIHPEAKSCLAYVVIAPPPPPPSSSTTTSSSHKSAQLSAIELAQLIAAKSDGTSFMDRVIRCDMASQPPSKKNPNNPSSHTIDNKEQRRTLFIGGLDFVEEEDSIRKAVESRLVEEKKGLPEGAATWVERVRVVRDKATSLTKGFAYVLLRTQNAVEEMLALPEGSFKIGKRRVRLQKYLSSGQSSALKRVQEQTTKNGKGEKRGKPNSLNASQDSTKRPRIDLTKEIQTKYQGPDQSQELALLDKSERKKIKSANQARVERRMLKKQNQLKMKILDSQKSSHKKQEFHNTLKPFKKSVVHKLASIKDSKNSNKNKALKNKNKSKIESKTSDS